MKSLPPNNQDFSEVLILSLRFSKNYSSSFFPDQRSDRFHWAYLYTFSAIWPTAQLGFQDWEVQEGSSVAVNQFFVLAKVEGILKHIQIIFGFFKPSAGRRFGLFPVCSHRDSK